MSHLQHDSSRVLEGHNPRGTTLRCEALRGNLGSWRPLRAVPRGLSEGSDPILETLENCWRFFRLRRQLLDRTILVCQVRRDGGREGPKGCPASNEFVV